MTGVEGVSQVLLCDPCIGGEFSVGQKLLAWAKAGGTSAIRKQSRQKKVEDSMGERGRAGVCVPRVWHPCAPAALSTHGTSFSPTTARGEVTVHHAEPVRGKRPALVRAAQSRRVSTRTGICRLVLC